MTTFKHPTFKLTDRIIKMKIHTPIKALVHSMAFELYFGFSESPNNPCHGESENAAHRGRPMDPSGPGQTYNGTALPLHTNRNTQYFFSNCNDKLSVFEV